MSVELPEGAALGTTATVVQFSSAFCQPCRATRRVIAQVLKDAAAGGTTGVEVIEIDADDNLELTRRWGVQSTPTVVFLDADGREVHRGSGQPRTPDIVAGLGKAVG